MLAIVPLGLWLPRLLVVAASLGLWFWSQARIGRRVNPTATEGGTIRDRVHDRTARWHRWLLAHPRHADGLLILSSLGIDLLGVYLLASAIWGPTFAPFVGLGLVFALRQICQAYCALPTPPGMIWRYPGFPALLVTYGTANDLFFSGHTAIAVYGALCLGSAFGVPGMVGGALLALFEIATVLVLRAHYTMDVFAGLLAALYAHHLATRIAPWVDPWLSQLGR
ncbi:MAG: phosphatase PAP2 family protein [Verrucomicrobia bacterium]|nr:phosphatase PAP2 family protein [Verrucomicrobiota bacterium]